MSEKSLKSKNVSIHLKKLEKIVNLKKIEGNNKERKLMK